MDSSRHRLYNKNLRLFECIESNKPTAEKLIGLKRCLEQRADVNATNEEGITPLHLAVCYEKPIVLKQLLKRGANVNAQDVHGNTPLHKAVQCKKKFAVDLLLKKGANVNVQDEDGNTPLHDAARSGEMAIVVLLLNNGADLNAQKTEYTTHNLSSSADTSGVVFQLNTCVTEKDEIGYTPLHAAVSSGKTFIIELLLNKGADVNAQTKSGLTPLFIAACSDETSVVELLLKRGANVNTEERDGSTPLFAASQLGKTRIVEILVNNGAIVNKQSTLSRFTPLHEAVTSGETSTVKFLLDKGANVNALTIKGETPLYGAVCYSNTSIVELLLKNDADVNVQTKMGISLLHIAIRTGSLAIAELLVNYRVNVNAQTTYGYTPLHEAVRYEEISVVELLLNNGAEVNAQDTYGDTPLHLAALKQESAFAALLVRRGADVKLRNKTGDNALSYALKCSNSDPEIISLLQTVEADARCHHSQTLKNTFQSEARNILSNDQQKNKLFEYFKTVDTSGLAGQLYETNMVSLVFIRMLNHDKINRDILLGSNINGIGALDDICIRYCVKGRQRPIMLFMQIKHRDNPENRKLTENSLWSESGEFSLKKFFSSYLMIKNRFQVGNKDPMFEGDFHDVDCYFVLYTSAKESIAKKKRENRMNKILHGLINTGHAYHFQYSFDEADINRLTKVVADIQINSIEYDKTLVNDFFNRLWFYPSQATENKVGSIIKDEIKKYYNNEKISNCFEEHADAIYLKVHHKIQNWWKKRGEVPYLSRADDFFLIAKLEYLDSALFAVSSNMDYLKVTINLEFLEDFKLRDTSFKTPRGLNPILCKSIKIMDSEEKFIGLKNEIVNLLLTNQKFRRKNDIPSSGSSNNLSDFLRKNDQDGISNTDELHKKQFKYLKRTGTSEVGGVLFKMKMLNLVHLRALNHEKIEQDTLLGTKLKDISAMNDICLRYRVKGEKRPVVLCVQLIHRDDPEKSKLYDESMWTDFDDFSLRKLYTSYLEIKNKFRTDNKDSVFNGDFKDINCYLVLYTSAKESITKKKTEIKINKVVHDLINTRQNSEPFQYSYDETDIDLLTNATAMKRFVKLGIDFYECLRTPENYKRNLFASKLIAKYHVAIAREVLQKCEKQSDNQEYHSWQIQPEFFDSELEPLVTLKKTFVNKLASEREFNQNKITNESQHSNVSDTYREKLLSLEIKLPVTFGNLDMMFCGSKVQKKIKSLADDLIYLLKLNNDTKIIEIDDDDEGSEKIMKRNIIKVKNGIGSAVGNILVLDKDTHMLKFELETKDLPQNAALFLNELRDDRHRPYNEDLSKYRLIINANDFPKYSFNVDEHEKRQAREFFSKFWVYPDQGKEEVIEETFKEELDKIYCVSKIHNTCRNTSDLIALHSLSEMQGWWRKTSEAHYLHSASNIFGRSEIIDIYNLIQTVVSCMHITGICNTAIKVERANKDVNPERVREVCKNLTFKLYYLFGQQLNEPFELKRIDFEECESFTFKINVGPDLENVSAAMITNS